jgi:hypothetical protein
MTGQAPVYEARKHTLQTAWLASLPTDAVLRRLTSTGESGFTATERAWMLNQHPDPYTRALVRGAQDPAMRAALQEAKAEARAAAQAERAAKLAEIRSQVAGLDPATHGTMGAAKEYAAVRYADPANTRRLGDIVREAGEVHLLPAETILLALAGDGARAIANVQTEAPA